MSITPPPAAGSTAPAAGFTITRQDHQSVYDLNDPNASQWTVYFTTPAGVDSFVTVPDSDYNPENVGKLIAQKVAQIEAVANLGGGKP